MAYLENGTGTTQTKPLPKDTKKKDINKEDLHAQSEEDLALSQHLELYVERIYDVDPEVQKVALESMRQEVRTSISSMTYVPKLLKFLRPHYGTLKAFYETMLDSNLKRSSGILAREILQEYPMRQSEDASVDDLMELVEQIVAFHMEGINFELDDDMVKDDEDRELSHVIINNIKLSESYLTLARNIEVMEPKCPEDVYKAHLLDGRAIAGANVDSVRQNLAPTFVNAFLNADPADSSSDGSSRNWLFKNKEHVKISVVASLGMILLWDVDSGLAQIDKYLHSDDNYVIAGVLLGVGLVNCSVTNDYDPALVLSE
ncbi:26S proteasome non-ATPase regulatory subunit 2 1A -like protein [Gossypium arboreum]|uniref:26S proteasome non-ATPase regulatory subunit 2 1A-like protein n=1 Tax=Gossypium arboreum TaxID=29729 RepID=A0A0B0PZE5_GOSAR|nr:26S proteasome non-ATPase regulatory subunit 2 1A -like protein [Gossypium arboreum]